MDALIESLEKLIRQSAEALGPDAPSTLMLKEQLAAALAQQAQTRKVLWIQPVNSAAESPKKD